MPFYYLTLCNPVLTNVSRYFTPKYRGTYFYFSAIIYKMQDDVKKLYKAVSAVLQKARKDKGITYTFLCYENDIPMSTYDDIINAKTKASFYNIARIINALDLSYEEFGKLLDKKLSDNIFEH